MSGAQQGRPVATTCDLHALPNPTTALHVAVAPRRMLLPAPQTLRMHWSDRDAIHYVCSPTGSKRGVRGTGTGTLYTDAGRIVSEVKNSNPRVLVVQEMVQTTLQNKEDLSVHFAEPGLFGPPGSLAGWARCCACWPNAPLGASVEPDSPPPSSWPLPPSLPCSLLPSLACHLRCSLVRTLPCCRGHSRSALALCHAPHTHNPHQHPATEDAGAR